MQHRINCPRTASESISVDILHADSSNKVCAGLFCILVALFDRSLRQDSQSNSDLLLSPPKLENMKLKQLTHFCKFVTLKRDLHGPLADARWRSCSFQTLHSRYQMLVWKLVCKSEVVRTNSHLASSLYLFRSWNFELLTDFNNSQRLWNETKCWCADHQGCVGHAPCQHPLRRPPESWTIIAIIRFNSIWRTM